MEKDFWLRRWRNNDIAFHQHNVNPDLIVHFQKLKLHLGDHVFVPLCGKSRDMLWIADKKYDVTGVELSDIACQDFFADLKLIVEHVPNKHFTHAKYNNIELLCGDFFNLTSNDLSRPVNAIYDCKALIALPEKMRKDYVNHLIQCFGTKIKILLLAIESNDKVKGPPFTVTHDEIQELYGEHFVIQQVKSEPIPQLSEHHKKKGFEEIVETVYIMSEKPNFKADQN